MRTNNAEPYLNPTVLHIVFFIINWWRGEKFVRVTPSFPPCRPRGCGSARKIHRFSRRTTAIQRTNRQKETTQETTLTKRGTPLSSSWAPLFLKAAQCVLMHTCSTFQNMFDVHVSEESTPPVSLNYCFDAVVLVCVYVCISFIFFAPFDVMFINISNACVWVIISVGICRCVCICTHWA